MVTLIHSFMHFHYWSLIFLPKSRYASHFSIAVIKHHDGGNAQKEGVFAAYGSRWIRVHHHDGSEQAAGSRQTGMALEQQLKAHISVHKQDVERPNLGFETSKSLVTSFLPDILILPKQPASRTNHSNV